jgi:hypothetical protein
MSTNFVWEYNRSAREIPSIYRAWNKNKARVNDEISAQPKDRSVRREVFLLNCLRSAEAWTSTRDRTLMSREREREEEEGGGERERGRTAWDELQEKFLTLPREKKTGEEIGSRRENRPTICARSAQERLVRARHRGEISDNKFVGLISFYEAALQSGML